MKFWPTRFWRDQRGYTTVELITAATIFALISVVVLGALVTMIQSSTKTSAERKVQQDARYSIEEIARQARSASIDYQFYAKNAADSRCGFSPNGSNSTKALALIFTESNESSPTATKRLVFFHSNNGIYRYEQNASALTPTCTDVINAPLDAGGDGPTRSKITANTVVVPSNSLTFYVSPNQNPYEKTPCSAGDTNCEIARNTHPRVTILLTVRTVGVGTGVSQQTKIGSTTLETTVGSRAYPIKALLGPTPNPVVTQIINGSDFQNCQAPSRVDYCQTNDPAHPSAMYSLSGGIGNPNLSAQYKFDGIPAGTYTLTLSYYNFSLGNLNPPPNYSYRIRIDYPDGQSKVVNLPIESTAVSRNLHEFAIPDLTVTPNPPITITWDNDSYQAGNYDANFGLNSLRMTGQ